MATNQMTEFVSATKPQIARMKRLLNEEKLPVKNKVFIRSVLSNRNLSKKGASRVIYVAIQLLEQAGVHRSTDSLILAARQNTQQELPVELTDEYITD